MSWTAGPRRPRPTRAAVKGFEQAVRDQPGDLDLRAGLARAMVLQAGFEAEPESQVPLYRRVVAMRKICSRPVTATTGSRELSQSYNDLGSALRFLDPGESTRGHQQCIELCLELADAHPDDASRLDDLAESFNNIAAPCSRRAVQPEQVATLWQQAVEFSRARLDVCARA